MLKPLSQSKAIRLLRLLGALLPLALGLACAPPGQLEQNIHEPHQIYIDRKLLGKTAPEQVQKPIGEAGLPASCSEKRNPHQSLCIECQVDEWLIARCYRFQAELNAEETCFHTADTTKCLVRDPPFALAIAYRSSEERFLRENFLTWQNAIKQIWLEKLNEEEQAALQDMLQLLNLLALWLSTGPAEIPSQETLLGSLAEISQKPLQDLEQEKAMLERLQALRLEGKLGLDKLLDEGLPFLKGLTPNPKAFAALESLSIEGLDDN